MSGTRAFEPTQVEAVGTAAQDRETLRANLIAARVDGSKVADNIVQFARLLRASGLPVGPEKTVLATRAVMAAGIEDPKVLYWTLHSIFVSRRSDHDIFNQAFVLFWRDPGYLDQMLSLMLPRAPAGPAETDKALSRRLSEATGRGHDAQARAREDALEFELTGTWSDREVFREKDFEQMSAAELAAARRAIQTLRMPFEMIRTRRFGPAPSGGRLDLRRIIRDMSKKGPDYLAPAYRRRRVRRVPIVVLCDISGSMDTYARVLVHFLVALANDRDRVSAFLFGTRLTNVTRQLRDRDPDRAVAAVAKAASDWSGGTRIGAAITEFNRLWARRVLGQNALVLLFTDGLDRENDGTLETAARRLAASCRKLVWLNPLLRYDGWRAEASGAAVLARHADAVLPCHNLRSLAALTRAFSDVDG